MTNGNGLPKSGKMELITGKDGGSGAAGSSPPHLRHAGSMTKDAAAVGLVAAGCCRLNHPDGSHRKPVKDADFQSQYES